MSRMILLLSLFAITANAAQTTGIWPDELPGVIAAIGGEPEFGLVGQYTHGAVIRNSFSTRTAIIAYRDDMLWALGHVQQHVISGAKCADVTAATTKAHGKKRIDLDVVTSDGATHRFHLLIGQEIARINAQAIIEKMQSCAARR